MPGGGVGGRHHFIATAAVPSTSLPQAAAERCGPMNEPPNEKSRQAAGSSSMRTILPAEPAHATRASDLEASSIPSGPSTCIVPPARGATMDRYVLGGFHAR